jgi:hypothetical protein
MRSCAATRVECGRRPQPFSLAAELQASTRRDEHEEDSMKKRQLLAGLIAAACTATLGLAAQTPGPATGSQTPSPSQRAANQVTVTGCVQPGTASATTGATGTSGTAGASSSKESFILTHASSSSGASGASSASPSPSATGTSGMGTTYRLDADASKLTAHVGHKVEITGTIDKSSSASSSSASEPQLKVETVKMIAASCSN